MNELRRRMSRREPDSTKDSRGVGKIIQQDEVKKLQETRDYQAFLPQLSFLLV